MAKAATATAEPQAAAQSSAPPNEPSRTSSSPPELTFRVGRVTASVFINQTNTNGNGEQRARRFRSVAVQRSYRDEKGDTRFVSSFGLGEIRNAIRVLEMAAQHMEEKESVFTQ